jgi:hypothetical protein
MKRTATACQDKSRFKKELPEAILYEHFWSCYPAKRTSPIPCLTERRLSGIGELFNQVDPVGRTARNNRSWLGNVAYTGSHEKSLVVWITRC